MWGTDSLPQGDGDLDCEDKIIDYCSQGGERQNKVFVTLEMEPSTLLKTELVTSLGLQKVWFLPSLAIFLYCLHNSKFVARLLLVSLYTPAPDSY